MTDPKEPIETAKSLVLRERKQRLGRGGHGYERRWEVIDALMNGGDSLRSACAKPGMPAPKTFLQWCVDDPELYAAYEKSKRLRAASLIETVLDDATELRTEDDEKLSRVVSAKAHILFKAAALFDPQKWSEKLHGHTDRMGGANVVQININIGDEQVSVTTK